MQLTGGAPTSRSAEFPAKIPFESLLRMFIVTFVLSPRFEPPISACFAFQTDYRKRPALDIDE
jgi:hypothetical protein